MRIEEALWKLNDRVVGDLLVARMPPPQAAAKVSRISLLRVQCAMDPLSGAAVPTSISALVLGVGS